MHPLPPEKVSCSLTKDGNPRAEVVMHVRAPEGNRVKFHIKTYTMNSYGKMFADLGLQLQQRVESEQLTKKQCDAILAATRTG